MSKPHNFQREPHWYPANAWHLRHSPAALRSWLTDDGSLTQRLLNTSQGDFRVEVLSQRWCLPQHNEQQLLETNLQQAAFVREVQLICKGRPWVFARSVIPLATLHGPLRILTRLGSRPLGAVLFSNPAIHREPLQIACLSAGQAMYNAATEQGRLSRGRIWGRRSVFRFHQQPLLVSEVFLPAILDSE